MDKEGLSGWRGTVVSKAAEPLAERTPLSQEQIEAVVGGIFLALAAWQFFKLVTRVLRAGRASAAS